MDEYALRNRFGAIECKLCLTVHPSEANYLVHTKGRRHRVSVARREEGGRQRRTGGGVASNAVARAGALIDAVRARVEYLPNRAGYLVHLENLRSGGEVPPIRLEPSGRRHRQQLWVGAHVLLQLPVGEAVTRITTQADRRRGDVLSLTLHLYTAVSN
eukprot:ctg_1101.g360